MATSRKTETLAEFDKTNLQVVFNQVTITFQCKDAYEAQTLFDDLEQRLRIGSPLTFHTKP